MTIIDKACYERGCACYDDRVDKDGVKVVARKWVGLTAKERSDLWWETDMNGMPEHDYGKAIEAALKEKNT